MQRSINNGRGVANKLSVAGFVLLAAATTVTAQPIKVCSAATVLTMEVSQDTNRALFGDGAPEIRSAPSESGTLSVVALGPVLGSMDSRDFKPRVDCDASGIAVTTALTRSANYNGAAAKNVLWRPRIELRIVSPRVHGLLEVRWTMRLSTGAQLKHARTLPYAEQTFPLSVKKEL
jgi:hypothetical protein